jgi:hypothetical protein
MPQGDKSAYTDKQKRKAEQIEEGYEDRGVSEKKPNAAPGPPSTRKVVVARNQAQAEAMPKTTRLPKRADARVAQLPRRAPRKNARPQRKRLQPLASATNTICIIDRIRRHDSGAGFLWRNAHVEEEIQAKVVAGCDREKRCTGSEGRCLQKAQREEDRRLAEGLGRA